MAHDLDLRFHHRDLAHPDVTADERKVIDPSIDPPDLVRALVPAALGYLQAFQGEVTREEIQIDVVDEQRAAGKLGNLIDGDTAHDLGQHRNEHPAEGHHQHEDADQDLERAAGNAVHQDLLQTSARALVPGARHAVIECISLPRLLNRNTTNVEQPP